jgi:hypothetical protein
MPPPKASSEAVRDQQARHEIRQISRAVAELGPVSPGELGEALGVRFWEPGRFDAALRIAVRDGIVIRDSAGLLTTV